MQDHGKIRRASNCSGEGYPKRIGLKYVFFNFIKMLDKIRASEKVVSGV